jgi:hypothetical protein
VLSLSCTMITFPFALMCLICGLYQRPAPAPKKGMAEAEPKLAPEHLTALPAKPAAASPD